MAENDRPTGDSDLAATAQDRLSPLLWLALFLAATLLFYLLDHGLMALQGLPLAVDLTPAR